MNNKLSPSKSRKSIFLLIAIAFIHILCIAMAAHLDLFRRAEYSFARASNPNYWLWISIWYCVWVGWLTIIWTIYKLVKKSPSSYFEQVFDLTVLVANLTMLFAFIGNFAIYYLSNKKIEWIYVPDMDNPARTIPLFNTWKIRTQTYYWINTTISHFVPALLILYYFWKWGQVNQLVKKIKLTILGMLVNPLVYFCYVIFREKMANLWIHPSKLSYDFPRNYPMVFFYRIMGQPAYPGDTGYSPSLVFRFFYLVGTAALAFFLFTSLAHFLIRWKSKK